MDFERALIEIPLSAQDIIDFAHDSYNTYTVRVREVECAVIDKEDCQYVLPRGTEASGLISDGGIRDVLRDLRAYPWPSKRIPGRSHAGFYKGARGLVDKGLYGVLRREKPIRFIGHSLGAAIALNAAVLLHREGFIIEFVVGLGCPRTFTRRTAKRVAKLGFPIYEFSNPGDPVPDVPFRFWGYRHINEIKTPREAKGYFISKNHMMPHYQEAFTDGN